MGKVPRQKPRRRWAPSCLLLANTQSFWGGKFMEPSMWAHVPRQGKFGDVGLNDFDVGKAAEGNISRPSSGIWVTADTMTETGILARERL